MPSKIYLLFFLTFTSISADIINTIIAVTIIASLNVFPTDTDTIIKYTSVKKLPIILNLKYCSTKAPPS